MGQSGWRTGLGWGGCAALAHLTRLPHAHRVKKTEAKAAGAPPIGPAVEKIVDASVAGDGPPARCVCFTLDALCTVLTRCPPPSCLQATPWP